MFKLVKEIHERRELLMTLVYRNLKIRYKGTALGFVWSLLTPLLFILIYAVFAHILKFSASRPNYLEFLIVGIVVWQFLSMCLNDSLSAILGNANLIKKTSFSRFILPLSMVVANLINFVLTLLVLVVYLLATRNPFGCIALLPVVILTQAALCLGLALLLSTANVFFRDTEHILGILTLAWFFLTPIFYPLSHQLDVLPPDLTWLAFLNPMTGIVYAYRAVFTSEPLLAAGQLAVSFGVAWVVCALGIVIFQACEGRLSDEM